jgi:hypothetical protein
MKPVPPTRLRPPRSSRAGWLPRVLLGAAIAAAVALGGCQSLLRGVSPGLGGLLVADGGPLLVTDLTGSLGPFDGPRGPVARVVASDGVVVAVDPSGAAVTSDGSASPRTWRDLLLPSDAAPGVPLVALSPLGKALAVAIGPPQGSSFDLAIQPLGVGNASTIHVERGLNGPPSWIGPGTVAIDVIEADGMAAIATIDVGTGVVTDRAGPGTTISSSLDAAHVAFDDPASGDVLVGDRAAWQHGPPGGLARIAASEGAGPDDLAMNAGGGRLAIVRRTDAGHDIEILRRTDDGTWSSLGTIHRAGDGPIVVAWLD